MIKISSGRILLYGIVYGAMYGRIYGTIYGTIYLTIHQYGGGLRPPPQQWGGRLRRPPTVVESIVVNGGNIVPYGTIYPTIHGTINDTINNNPSGRIINYPCGRLLIRAEGLLHYLQYINTCPKKRSHDGSASYQMCSLSPGDAPQHTNSFQSAI